MRSKGDGIRLHQIKSYSAVFPDSCIMLNYIFNEEEFRPKIEYFSNMVAKGIPCEILPKVNVEIVERLFNATEEFAKTLRRCKGISQFITKQSLDKIFIVKETAEILEQAFSRVFVEISKKYFRTFAEKTTAIRRARVVETSVMLEFWNAIGCSENITLSAFLDKLENNFKEKYIEFCDKQSLFMERLNANSLKQEDLPQTANSLQEILCKCGVRNESDVEVLCQAIGRMYGTNKWCALVTIDYGDLIRNKVIIEKLTQLIVSDPLYFVYHLDKKIDFALHPKDGASRMNIDYVSFIKSPPDIGIV